MSLRLYLDDCADSDRLLSILRGAPFKHIVVTPRDVGMVGADDPDHFAFAQQNALLLSLKGYLRPPLDRVYPWLGPGARYIRNHFKRRLVFDIVEVRRVVF